MKAMILAAGLGTRLKPWTLHHPKALVPVGGKPMLQRVIENLRSRGFDYIVVNVHHFSQQIVDFLNSNDFGVEIVVSDETDRLLDTGGAILKAKDLLRLDSGPVLVHNVDILSDADLVALMREHEENGNDSTLLVSLRDSGRKLVFDEKMSLIGWHHMGDDRYLPPTFSRKDSDREYAFSGIHVVGKGLVERMEEYAADASFPIVDFLLSEFSGHKVNGFLQENLHLIDIGKPATLSQANHILDA